MFEMIDMIAVEYYTENKSLNFIFMREYDV